MVSGWLASGSGGAGSGGGEERRRGEEERRDDARCVGPEARGVGVAGRLAASDVITLHYYGA